MTAGPARTGDAGFTLSELLISMAVMSVVTLISAAGFVDMFRTTDRTEAAALTQSSTLAAFSKLDRDVRYAIRVNAPYQRPDGDFAVDYVLPGDAGVAQCVRLTLPATGGALTRRQWPQGTPASGHPATDVALDLQPVDASAGPFTQFPGGTDGSNFDRLEIRLKSTVGVASAGATRVFDLQFTALNTASAGTALPCDQS